jgi:hypothetical protein
MLTLFVVFFLIGCIPVPDYYSAKNHDIYKAQIDPYQESVRLFKIEGLETPLGAKIGIVEVTNNRFKMLVYAEPGSDYLFIEMLLIVPAGEELLVRESSVEVFDTATLQEPNKFDFKWQISSEVHTASEEDIGRLIGLVSSPPATIYHAHPLVSVNGEEFDLKLPVISTKGNETIIFDDITFKKFRALDWRLQPIVGI